MSIWLWMGAEDERDRERSGTRHRGMFCLYFIFCVHFVCIVCVCVLVVSVEIVKYLVTQCRAEVDARDERDSTSLAAAIMKNQMEIVRVRVSVLCLVFSPSLSV